MKTLKHFKYLYQTTRDKGLLYAMQYETLVTAIRHPKISSNLCDVVINSKFIFPNVAFERKVATFVFLKSVIINSDLKKRLE